jgi:hypothetical protein
MSSVIVPRSRIELVELLEGIGLGLLAPDQVTRPQGLARCPKCALLSPEDQSRSHETTYCSTRSKSSCRKSPLHLSRCIHEAVQAVPRCSAGFGYELCLVRMKLTTSKRLRLVITPLAIHVTSNHVDEHKNIHSLRLSTPIQLLLHTCSAVPTIRLPSNLNALQQMCTCITSLTRECGHQIPGCK